MHCLTQTSIEKKHKIESTVYTFSIPSLRAPTAIILQLIAIEDWQSDRTRDELAHG